MKKSSVSILRELVWISKK